MRECAKRRSLNVCSPAVEGPLSSPGKVWKQAGQNNLRLHLGKKKRVREAERKITQQADQVALEGINKRSTKRYGDSAYIFLGLPVHVMVKWAAPGLALVPSTAPERGGHLLLQIGQLGRLRLASNHRSLCKRQRDKRH